MQRRPTQTPCQTAQSRLRCPRTTPHLTPNEVASSHPCRLTATVSENRQRGLAAADGRQPWPDGKRPIKQAWLSLAVTCAESERRCANANLAGRPWTPSNGFEDRAPSIRERPLRSAHVHFEASRILGRPAPSTIVRWLGCQVPWPRETRSRPPSYFRP